MQIRDQLDECRERYSEQQAHHTPQPAPEENANRCRHRPDTYAIGNKFRDQKIRRHDMQEENGQSDDNVRSRCAELKEGRRKRKSKRSDQSEERQQIQKSTGYSERYGAFHANTPQHHRRRHGHKRADDKVAGYETVNHLVQVRDEPSRVYPGAEEAVGSNGHLVLGAEHEERQKWNYAGNNQRSPHRSHTAHQIVRPGWRLLKPNLRDFLGGMHVVRKVSSTLLKVLDLFANWLNGLLNRRGVHRKFFRKGHRSP